MCIRDRFITPRFPFVIAEVTSGSEAEKMGFKKGDSIVAFNDAVMNYHDEFTTNMKALAVGAEVKVTVVGADKQVRNLTGIVPETKKLGIGPKFYDEYLEFKTIKYLSLIHI